MTNWLAGMKVTAARLADGIDPTTTTTGLSAASGFSVNSFLGKQSGKIVVVDMYLFRSGTTITASSGNITDTAICTLPSGWRPPDQTINGTWDNGSAEGGFVVGTDGVCTLRTANGNIVGEASSAGNGTNLRLHIGWINN